jgi:glycosyltransferase involved in cell wall biosynthesis
MFSVIIPLYNKEKYIHRTISSVLSQSYKEFEILIINDGSTDNSKVIVEAFKDDRICLIEKINGGESSARNLGIKMAKYNYIAFLDADDTWQSNFLSEIRKLIICYDSAGIYTSNYLIKTAKGKLKTAIKGECFNNSLLIEDYFKESRIIPLVTSNTAVIPKNVFEEVGDFNESLKYGPDLDMWYRIAKKFRIAFVPLLGATYYQDSENRACDDIRDFSIEFFLSIKKNYSYHGISSKVSERRYVNELVIKETLRVFNSISGQKARYTIKQCRKLGLPFSLWYLYYVSTFFPRFIFKILYRLNIYLLKFYEIIIYEKSLEGAQD